MFLVDFEGFEGVCFLLNFEGMKFQSFSIFELRSGRGSPGSL